MIGALQDAGKDEDGDGHIAFAEFLSDPEKILEL